MYKGNPAEEGIAAVRKEIANERAINALMERFKIFVADSLPHQIHQIDEIGGSLAFLKNAMETFIEFEESNNDSEQNR